MSEACPYSFDERLLSGHLDGELTQAEAQQVRIHLEDCDSCSALLEQLRRMREASMSTPFATPNDEQWNERPQTGPSRLFRAGGWFFLIAWIVASLVFALWCFVTEPGDPLLKLLVFSGVLGFVLLFLSVLLDRLRSAKTDRYTRVEK